MVYVGRRIDTVQPLDMRSWLDEICSLNTYLFSFNVPLLCVFDPLNDISLLLSLIIKSVFAVINTLFINKKAV